MQDQAKDYHLVLMDGETNARIQNAQKLRDSIKKVRPELPVVFLCNHLTSICSDCPDNIINASLTLKRWCVVSLRL